MRRIALALCVAALAACGGGGGGGSASTDAATSRTSAEIRSEAGDPIGEGKSFSYTLNNALITLDTSFGTVGFTVVHDGGEWRGSFPLPDPAAEPTEGMRLSGTVLHDTPTDYLICLGNPATAVVTRVVKVPGTPIITELGLQVDQQCAGTTGGLHARINWVFSDKTLPPGPAATPPAGLWDAAAASLPAQGNYIYVESQSGETVLQGKSRTFSSLDSIFRIQARQSDRHLRIRTFNGTDIWDADFRPMNGLDRIQPGYYSNIVRHYGNVDQLLNGSLSFLKSQLDCSELSGWYMVDRIEWGPSGQLTALDLRFEQHCLYQQAALRGKIHWSVEDTTRPPGPVSAPDDLWRPAAGSTPPSGTFLYLEGPANVIPGGAVTYTPQSTTFKVTDAGYESGVIVVRVDGSAGSAATFSTMQFQSHFAAGYYPQALSPATPTRGAVTWSAPNVGCGSNVPGWFVVDRVSYDDSDILTAFDARFEATCFSGAVLHGQVHWDQAP